VRYGQDFVIEANNLMNYLLISQAEIPEYQMRFPWRRNGIAFWETRCPQPHVVWEYFHTAVMPNEDRASGLSCRSPPD
jgi:taurine dioxygenase